MTGSSPRQVRIRLSNESGTVPLLDRYADFDAAIADPTDPTRILPIYDGGDRHHPNDAGYKLMADTFELALFE